MDQELTSLTYVVFDLETTGLYPNSGDTIIEIGAVKIKDGVIIDRYDELIYPEKSLSEEIIKITGITNEMLNGKRLEKECVIDFLNWVGDLPMVAHNAKFDISFIENAIDRYNLDKLSNVVLDTLGISRYLESGTKRT